MYPNLTTAYMAGEVERGLLETKANKQRLIDEAIESRAGRSWTIQVRHRIAMMLVSTGERLEGRPAPVYRSGLDDSFHPVR
jgi:hypothetical protein